MSIPDNNFSRKDGDAHRVPDAATARFLEALGFQAGVAQSPPQQTQAKQETFYVLCPGCHEELSIGRANFGVEGPCPTCGTRIVAGQDGDGSVQARIAGQFCPPPSVLGWPPNFGEQSSFEMEEPTPRTRAIPEQQNLVRMEYLVDPGDVRSATVEVRKSRRKRGVVAIGIAATIFAGLFSALMIGQFGERDSTISAVAAHTDQPVEEPVLAKVSNPSVEPQAIEASSKATQTALPDPASEVEASKEDIVPEPAAVIETDPTPEPAIAEPEGPTRTELGEATVRAFLAADNLTEKSLWILNPEENNPALRDFYFLEALVQHGEPQVEHVETLQVEDGRWISLFDVIQPVSLPHRVLIVHQPNGAAKVDFGLYRQMRENALHRFLAGPDQGSSRQFRVMLRQTDREVASISENFKEPALFFEVRLPYYPGAPGMVAVPVDSPVLEELQSAFYRHGGDLAAVVELKWQPSEVNPHEWVVTIGRLVQLGLWD